jgi:hypothetical protein
LLAGHLHLPVGPDHAIPKIAGSAQMGSFIVNGIGREVFVSLTPERQRVVYRLGGAFQRERGLLLEGVPVLGRDRQGGGLHTQLLLCRGAKRGSTVSLAVGLGSLSRSPGAGCSRTPAPLICCDDPGRSGGPASR